MKLGVGVDIIKVQRIEDAINRSGETFLKKTFTEGELGYAHSKGDYIAHLATMFAGKEAVLKALSMGGAGGIDLSEVEIKHDKDGRPFVSFSDKLKKRVLGGEAKNILLSLSYDTDYAVAFSIFIKEENYGKSFGEFHGHRGEVEEEKGAIPQR